MGILYRLAWALLIIQSGQSRAKVGNKLKFPRLLLLIADFWELVGQKIKIMRLNSKKISIVLLLIMCAVSVSAKKKAELFTVKQGDPLILLQKKTATFEIDYSKMMVTDGKDHENDLSFSDWMISQDEDNDKWIQDWEEKDSVECHKAFRDSFNDEIKNGIKLTKIGKDYKVTLRLSEIYIGKHAKGGKVALSIFLGGGAGLNAQRESAVATGELQVENLKTGEMELILAFKDLVGEESLSQIGRIKGLYENLGEHISDFLKDYQKEQKKLEKQKK